ncbi:hypothetical protein ACGK9U_05020 [Mariniflexile sp. HNIBRBA6329]|uniref:hypothetical protein n=1 Tax=Mariniflexile sp. HNIBRBA6329 TaxID=3373088 RepID=UPI003747598F
MKDLFVSIVEAIFNNDNEEDYTFRKLLIVVVKVLVFIALITLGIWIALKLKK